MKELAELKKIFQSHSNNREELIKASKVTLEEYISANPGLLDFSSNLFEKGMVTNNQLIVEVGHPGTAFMHAPGSPVPKAQAYVNRVSTELKRFTYSAELDYNADPNNILSKLIMDAKIIRDQLTLAKLQYVWNLILAAAQAGQIPAYLSANSVTKANMDSLINQLSDACGTVKAIIGRKSLISQIYGWSGWSEAALEDIENNKFTQYRGAKLIGFEQCRVTKVDSGTGNVYAEDILPPNMLILVGDQCGFEGSTPIKTFSAFDNNRLCDTISVTFDYAALIVDNRKIGVYEIA